MSQQIRPTTRATDGQYLLMTWLQTTQQRLLASWAKLTTRERLFLSSGGLLILLTAGWLITVKPALSSIQNDRQRIVHLQTDLARVQAIGLQAQYLRSYALIGEVPDPSTDDLQQSLAQAGLPITVAPVSGSTPSEQISQWELRIDQAKVDDLMQWLTRSLQAYNVRVVNATLHRAELDQRDRPGYVTGAIRLADDGAQP